MKWWREGETGERETLEWVHVWEEFGTYPTGQETSWKGSGQEGRSRRSDESLGPVRRVGVSGYLHPYIWTRYL